MPGQWAQDEGESPPKFKEENKRIKSTHNRLYKNMYWVNECIINTETEKEGEEEKKS